MARTDRHGQPLSYQLHRDNRLDRDIMEMLGMVRGVLADGVVTAEEAEALRSWCARHPDAVSCWPGEVLARRLQRIFEDGIVDDEERADLKDLLERMVGEGERSVEGADMASTLPITHPVPDVSLDGATVVLTGKFALGPRKACQAVVEASGGICKSSVSQKVDYLVIGAFASRDWKHTSHGRKIEAAVLFRENGIPIAIIGEEHLVAALDAG